MRRLTLPCVTSTPFGLPVEPAGINHISQVFSCGLADQVVRFLLSNDFPIGVQASHLRATLRQRL